MRSNNTPRPDDNYRPKFYNDVLQAIKKIDIKQVKWETSYFYTQIIEKEYKHPKAYENFWKNVNGIEPEEMWKHIYTSHANGKQQDIHFKFIHRILPTNDFMKKRFKGRGYNQTDPKCKGCTETETNEHIFFQCIHAKDLWAFIKPSIAKLLQNTPFKMFKLTMNTTHKNIALVRRKLVITLIQITLHTIWLNRNRLKFKNEKPFIDASKRKIQNDFEYTIKNKYHNYIKKNMLEKFRKDFCHTPEICNIVDNNLMIGLLTHT